jgi:hypothetical protein
MWFNVSFFYSRREEKAARFEETELKTTERHKYEWEENKKKESYGIVTTVVGFEGNGIS